MGMISRNEVKVGDHIYTWRTVYIYSHHGIYVGEDRVIHFTRQDGPENKTGTFLDNINISSTPNYHKNPCPKCKNQSKSSSSSSSSSSSKSVVSSCLDCFLAGGTLYLFEYNLSWAQFLGRLRGGTCTTASSDSPQEVVHRANYLWEQNGFGDYNLFKNNCEDFAIYCKTSLLVSNRNVVGGSGQVNSAIGFMLGLGGFAMGNVIRLTTDIGIRKDVVKVSVKNLVHQIKKGKIGGV